MPRTIADIRKFDRERKRLQRAAAAAAGIPSAPAVNAAIVEALAFAGSAGVNIEAAKTGAEPSIGMSAVLSAAHKILVSRLGFDGAASTTALLKALSPRPEHRWPSYVPSHHIASTQIDPPPVAEDRR